MGIKHFSGLFVMLCVGVALSLLTTLAELIVYKLVIPRVKEPRFKYWLHTSQVLNSHTSAQMNGRIIIIRFVEVTHMKVAVSNRIIAEKNKTDEM